MALAQVNFFSLFPVHQHNHAIKGFTPSSWLFDETIKHRIISHPRDAMAFLWFLIGNFISNKQLCCRSALNTFDDSIMFSSWQTSSACSARMVLGHTHSSIIRRLMMLTGKCFEKFVDGSLDTPWLRSTDETCVLINISTLQRWLS